jgi:sortase A
MSRSTTGLKRLERWLLVTGVILLAIFAAAMIHRSVSSQAALVQFDQMKATAAETPQVAALDVGDERKVDYSLWSKERRKGHQESLESLKGAPVAVLTVGRLSIRVPVFEGTDELALYRGAGWIAGTARPGQDGNIGIAGHRDGFFRVLKDVKKGDRVELATLQGTRHYAVDEIEIVTPENVSVLQNRAAPSVTLVTCYPFYFIGDAPQRWIVHAALTE